MSSFFQGGYSGLLKQVLYIAGLFVAISGCGSPADTRNDDTRTE